MLTVLYYIILLLNIFLLFTKRKPKIILPIDFIFIFILFYGTTTTTNDYQYYVLMYDEGLRRTTYEVGFNFLLDVIKITGISFQGFLGVLWIIFGGILIYIFSRYSKNYPLFFSCYMIYVLFIDIVQLKSFCASVLLLCAFHNYFKNNKTLFIVFNVLAATVHLEVVFFLPLVFIDSSKLKSQKFMKRCGEIILVLCIVFFFARNVLSNIVNNIGMSLLSVIDITEKLEYFNTTTNFGFLLYFALHFAIILSTYYGKRKLRFIRGNKTNNIKKEKNDNIKVLKIKLSSKRKSKKIHLEKNNMEDIISKVQLIQFYCLFCFPLIMVNMNFYRLYRVTIFASYIAWAIELDAFASRKVGYYKCLFGMLLSSAIYRIPIIQGNNQISVILENNSIVR